MTDFSEEDTMLYNLISDNYDRISIFAHKLSKDKGIDFTSAMDFVLHNNLLGVVENIELGVSDVESGIEEIILKR